MSRPLVSVTCARRDSRPPCRTCIGIRERHSRGKKAEQPARGEYFGDIKREASLALLHFSLPECCPFVDGLVVADQPRSFSVVGLWILVQDDASLPEAFNWELFARGIGRCLDPVRGQGSVPANASHSDKVENAPPVVHRRGRIALGCIPGRLGRSALIFPLEPLLLLLLLLLRRDQSLGETNDDPAICPVVGRNCLESLCSSETRIPLFAPGVFHPSRFVLGNVAHSVLARTVSFGSNLPITGRYCQCDCYVGHFCILLSSQFGEFARRDPASRDV